VVWEEASLRKGLAQHARQSAPSGRLAAQAACIRVDARGALAVLAWPLLVPRPATARLLLRCRVLSFVVGVAGAVALLGPGRVPADYGAARGAELRVAVSRTGELDVAPVGELLAAPNLRPGRQRAARLAVRNHTGEPVRVRLRARAVSRELDGSLLVRLSARRRDLYSGTLGGLREWTRPFPLGPGRGTPVIVRAEMAPGARGYEGRSVDVTLEPRS